MSYYDHATHLALRLDQWNFEGANGSGLHDPLDVKRLRPIQHAKKPSRLRRLFSALRGFGKATRAAERVG